MPEELREDYIIRINDLGKLYSILFWIHYFSNFINIEDIVLIYY